MAPVLKFMKLVISVSILCGLSAVSATAQNPLGSKGQVLNLCEGVCDRKRVMDKEGNYLFESTKATNTCDGKKHKGTKDADGKSEKIELTCHCRFIGTYHSAKATKKPAKGDMFDYADHVDGDQADLDTKTILKATREDLEDHGWVISVACIGMADTVAVFKDNPKKPKPKAKDDKEKEEPKDKPKDKP